MITLSKMFFFLLLVANTLASIEPTIYDEKIIHKDWPELHKLIVQKKFEEATLFAEEKLDQVTKRASASLTWDDISSFYYLWERAAKDPRLHFLKVDTWHGYYDNAFYTSLELAILCDAPLDFIELLISKGADPNSKRITLIKIGSHHGPFGIEDVYYVEARTPLYAAFKKNQLEIAELLLNHGASSEEILWKGETYKYIGDYADTHFRAQVIGWIILEEKETLR